MELSEREDRVVAAAHQRWYEKQPMTHCRRCDRLFPNTTKDAIEYCSYECELGWFPQGRPMRKIEMHRPRQYKKKHLPVSHYQSRWS